MLCQTIKHLLLPKTNITCWGYLHTHDWTIKFSGVTLKKWLHLISYTVHSRYIVLRIDSLNTKRNRSNGDLNQCHTTVKHAMYFFCILKLWYLTFPCVSSNSGTCGYTWFSTKIIASRSLDTIQMVTKFHLRKTQRSFNLQ